MNPIEPDQLAILWAKAQPHVAGFISSLVRDFHAADDILQNVAAIVVRKRPEYDPEQPFAAWVIGIARLEVLKHQRATARDRHQFDPEVVDMVAAAYETGTPQHEARRSALAACLETIKGQALKAIRLRYAEDLSLASIAEKLGISVNAATVMMHRTRKALHDCVERRLRREEA